MRRKRVAVQGLSSNASNFCMYSLLYPESNLGRYSGMVPETLRILSEDILGRCDEDPIPSTCNCPNWYDSIGSAQ